jgi:hypothetical protein
MTNLHIHPKLIGATITHRYVAGNWNPVNLKVIFVKTSADGRIWAGCLDENSGKISEGSLEWMVIKLAE